MRHNLRIEETKPNPLVQEETYERVRKLLARFLCIEEKAITFSSKLREDLGVDSVDVWDIAVALEREFQVDIGDYEATWIVTVDDLVSLILKKTQGKVT